ncbi:MAG: hypothetical protein LBP36_04430 [Oscillospiraceae bacterium]|jgi:hypothetical protein|nr:hypothetical protein [Oscillospiraceae bacterium]
MEDIRTNKTKIVNLVRGFCSVFYKYNSVFCRNIVEKHCLISADYEPLNLPSNGFVFLSRNGDRELLDSIIGLLKQLCDQKSGDINVQNNTVIRRQILEKLQNEVEKSEKNLNPEQKKDLEVIYSNNFNEKTLTRVLNSFIAGKKKASPELPDKLPFIKISAQTWSKNIEKRYKNVLEVITRKTLSEKIPGRENVLEEISNKNKIFKKEIFHKKQNLLESGSERHLSETETISLKGKIIKKQIDRVNINKLQTEHVDFKEKIKNEFTEELSKFRKTERENFAKELNKEIKSDKIKVKPKSLLKKLNEDLILEKELRVSAQGSKKDSSKHVNFFSKFTYDLNKIIKQIIEKNFKNIKFNNLTELDFLMKKNYLVKSIYKKNNRNIKYTTSSNFLTSEVERKVFQRSLINKRAKKIFEEKSCISQIYSLFNVQNRINKNLNVKESSKFSKEDEFYNLVRYKVKDYKKIDVKNIDKKITLTKIPKFDVSVKGTQNHRRTLGSSLEGEQFFYTNISRNLNIKEIYREEEPYKTSRKKISNKEPEQVSRNDKICNLNAYKFKDYKKIDVKNIDKKITLTNIPKFDVSVKGTQKRRGTLGSSLEGGQFFYTNISRNLNIKEIYREEEPYKTPRKGLYSELIKELIYKRNFDTEKVLESIEKKVPERKHERQSSGRSSSREYVNEKLKNRIEEIKQKKSKPEKEFLTKNEVEDIVRSYIKEINFTRISNAAVAKMERNLQIDRYRSGVRK